MEETKIMEAVNAFVELPRAERKAKFFNLPKEVQARARVLIERRRGIAHRSSDGDMVLTEEAYDAEIARIEGRIAELPAKKDALENKLAELKNKKIIHYGN